MALNFSHHSNQSEYDQFEAYSKHLQMGDSIITGHSILSNFLYFDEIIFVLMVYSLGADNLYHYDRRLQNPKISNNSWPA